MWSTFLFIIFIVLEWVFLHSTIGIILYFRLGIVGANRPGEKSERSRKDRKERKKRRKKKKDDDRRIDSNMLYVTYYTRFTGRCLTDV